ncbi:uncharacterized protein ACIBXB_003318 isoform 1-T1 [Morphnus guianensis]
MPAGLGVPHSLLPFPGQSHLPKPPSPDTGHQPVPNPTGPTTAPSPWPDTGGLTGSGEPDPAFPPWHTLPVTLSCPSSVRPRCPQALAPGTKPAWGAFLPAHHPFPELSWLHEIGFSPPKPPPPWPFQPHCSQHKTPGGCGVGAHGQAPTGGSWGPTSTAQRQRFALMGTDPSAIGTPGWPCPFTRDGCCEPTRMPHGQDSHFGGADAACTDPSNISSSTTDPAEAGHHCPAGTLNPTPRGPTGSGMAAAPLLRHPNPFPSTSRFPTASALHRWPFNHCLQPLISDFPPALTPR